MVFKKRIPEETRAYARMLRRHMNMSFRKIATECNISASSVLRILRGKAINRTGGRPIGRPRTIKPTQERYILRELKKLRRREGTFTVSRLMQVAGIYETNVSKRTVLNLLHRNGYRFRQTRKKGLLTKLDLSKRMQFARKMAKRPANFWCEHVAFFLDGVAFTYKTNPLDQARAPKSRIYRKKSEGLAHDCTSKGKKEGTGGKYAKFIVAISYGKGVIKCEPYEKMSGAYFADFIRNHFRDMFQVADKNTDLFVQDGDPSQNSAAAREAMNAVDAQLLNIPPRSPDINPIENFFHLVSEKLRQDAVVNQYMTESFAEFEARVINTMRAIPQDVIDNTIASTRKRLLQIIASRGQRIKY